MLFWAGDPLPDVIDNGLRLSGTGRFYVPMDQKGTRMQTKVVEMVKVQDSLDLERIANLIEESSALAHKGDYKFLSYLLNMARMEAKLLSTKQQESQTEG